MEPTNNSASLFEDLKTIVHDKSISDRWFGLSVRKTALVLQSAAKAANSAWQEQSINKIQSISDFTLHQMAHTIETIRSAEQKMLTMKTNKSFDLDLELAQEALEVSVQYRAVLGGIKAEMQNDSDNDKVNMIEQDEIALQLFEVSLNELVQNKLKVQLLEKMQDIPSFRFDESKTVEENRRKFKTDMETALIEHPGGGETVKGKIPKRVVIANKNYFEGLKNINQMNNPIEKLHALIRLVYTLGEELGAEVGGDLMSPLTIDLLSGYPSVGSVLIADLLDNTSEDITRLRREYEHTHMDNLNILTKEKNRIETRLEKIKNDGPAKAVERTELASKLSRIDHELNVLQSAEYSFINLVGAASHIHGTHFQRHSGK